MVDFMLDDTGNEIQILLVDFTAFGIRARTLISKYLAIPACTSGQERHPSYGHFVAAFLRNPRIDQNLYIVNTFYFFCPSSKPLVRKNDNSLLMPICGAHKDPRHRLFH